MSSMTRKITAAALALATALLSIPATPGVAQAQPAQGVRTDNLFVDYYEPRSRIYMPYYERYRQRKVLEEFADFLSPVRWRHKLRLLMKECPASGYLTGDLVFASPYYAGYEYTLNLCYQWFRIVEAFAPKEGEATFLTRGEAIVGGVIGVALHEAGHAIFDNLDIPRLGAEEDAADQIAAFIGLQFDKDVSRTVIKGIANVWAKFEALRIRGGQGFTISEFTDVHGLDQQRFYNTLCIGGDKALFQDLVDRGLLLKSRAAGCEQEYKQAQVAFNKTIMKHVDVDKMKAVQAKKWFRAEELK
jgi:hypothetical protein